MAYGYVNRHLSHEWRTEIRHEETPAILLPVMVFCSSSSWYKMAYCYNNIYLYDNETCGANMSRSSTLEYYDWTAGQYIEDKSQYLGGNCHAINIDRSIRLAAIGDTFLTRFQSPSHSPEDSLYLSLYAFQNFNGKVSKIPLNFDPYISLQSGYHVLYISQTHIERLPHPYSPNCTTSANPLNSFYTYSSCLQMCEWKEMHRKCGDVPDIGRKYFEEKLKNDTTNNSDRINCFDRVIGTQNLSNCHCPLACTERKYKTRTKTIESYNHSLWEIEIRIDDSYITQITQFASYTLEDALGAVGGILGLTIGASSLSVVEIVVYCTLFAASILY